MLLPLWATEKRPLHFPLLFLTNSFPLTTVFVAAVWGSAIAVWVCVCACVSSAFPLKLVTKKKKPKMTAMCANTVKDSSSWVRIKIKSEHFI